MEKYLDITKPHCSKNIFPLLWHSVISRFHCIFPQAGLEKGEGVTSRFNTRHFDTMIRTQAVKLHKNFDHFKYSFYVSKQWQIQERGLPPLFLVPAEAWRAEKFFCLRLAPPLSQGLDAPPPPPPPKVWIRHWQENDLAQYSSFHKPRMWNNLQVNSINLYQNNFVLKRLVTREGSMDTQG